MLTFLYGLIFNNLVTYKNTNYYLSLFPLACDSDSDCEGKQICNEITETVYTCECEHGYHWDGSECVGECFFTASNTLMVLEILFGSKF